MANNTTIFQRLNNLFKASGKSIPPEYITTSNAMNPDDRVLFTTSDKDEYEKKLNLYKQQKYLSYQWQKAGRDVSIDNLASYTAIKLMYRDADLMDGTPEIGTALDIISEETCPITTNGKMLNIHSNSKRIKSILEDLFINRLHIYTDLPMIARHTPKYGNTFMLLNITKDNGIMGWKMLPVYEIDRIEGGYSGGYSVNSMMANNSTDIKDEEVRFAWIGRNANDPFRNWQVAHFRFLTDSFFLPYGVSILHKSRRAWRMWSMMEDAMLIHRLDKAVERRIFKIFVGGIDDADVQAYVQEIANNFKRTPIIDPETGQIDLKRNFLDVSSDYFIPVRTENAPTPIETLAATNSEVQMEDIEYMQNKVFAGLRTPKTFLNFQEAQGKGQNLSLLDIRFSRMINRNQQFLLMELNKIAMIHLYLLGFGDDVTNFTLSLNNPSSQIEAQELADLTNRLNALQTSLADPGSGIPLLSLHKGLRDIMKMTDGEIKDMLNEIRLEKAMAAELASTTNVIKKTGMFDFVDNIYGDFEAMASGAQKVQSQGGGEGPGGGGPMMGGGGGLPPIGGGLDMDMGEPGGDSTGDLGGDMGETDMGGAPSLDSGGPIMESKQSKPLMKETTVKSFTKMYLDFIAKNDDLKTGKKDLDESFNYDAQAATLEHDLNTIFSKLDLSEDSLKKQNQLFEELEVTDDNV